MVRKTGLEIKKAILKTLKEKECSIRELETKINTNNITIKKHLEELEYLEHIKLTKHQKNKRNGRPYTTVKLSNK